MIRILRRATEANGCEIMAERNSTCGVKASLASNLRKGNHTSKDLLGGIFESGASWRTDPSSCLGADLIAQLVYSTGRRRSIPGSTLLGNMGWAGDCNRGILNLTWLIYFRSIRIPACDFSLAQTSIGQSV